MELEKEIKSNQNAEKGFWLTTILIAVFSTFLVIRRNYFIYYRTKAVVVIIGGTSFAIFLMKDEIGILIFITFLFVGILKFTDYQLWKYPPFSWMYIVKNISGTYEGVQENLYFNEFRESFYREKIFKEYKEHLKLTLIIHQTGSIIKVNFFYFDTQNEKSSKFEADQVILSKTDDDQHLILTCHHGEIGVLEKGGHHETVVLKFIQRNNTYYIEGGIYDNRKFQARGKFVKLKKISSAKDHPF